MRSSRHRRHQVRMLLRREVVICGLVALLALFAVASYAYRAQSGRSVEVSFTDDSQGMEIVPASCDSPPPPAPSNSAGYELNYEASNLEVDTQTYNFCVSDSNDGPSYFIPINSETELQDFYNAASKGQLPGVSQSAND